MNFECSTKITEAEFNKVFGRRILKSEKYDRWVIVNFCRTQYPKGLESNKPVIVSVRNVLEKYGFLSIIIESFYNHSEMIKDKDKDKDKDMDEEIGGMEERGLVKRETALAKTEPRTPEAIEAYFVELGRPDQTQVFIDYYSSNGWKVGKNAMKDWKATVRNWVRRASPEKQDDLNRRIVRDTKVSDMQRDAAIFENLVNNQNTNVNEND